MPSFAFDFIHIGYIILWAAYVVGTTIYFALKMVGRRPNPEAGEKTSLLEGNNSYTGRGAVVSISCGDRCCIGPVFLTSRPYITTNTLIAWYITANVLMSVIFGLGYYFFIRQIYI